MSQYEEIDQRKHFLFTKILGAHWFPELFSDLNQILRNDSKFFFFLISHHTKEVFVGFKSVVAPCISALSGSEWSFMLWPVYPNGKTLWYARDRSVGGSRVSLDTGAEKNLLPLQGVGSDSSAVQPTVQSLYWVSYTNSRVVSWLVKIWEFRKYHIYFYIFASASGYLMLLSKNEHKNSFVACLCDIIIVWVGTYFEVMR
jgi:hypothetical protein